MASIVQFLSLPKEKLDANTIKRLEMLIEGYPYFNTLHILHLLLLFKKDPKRFYKEFKSSHIYIHDLKHFYQQLSFLRYEFEFSELQKFVSSVSIENEAKSGQKNHSKSSDTEVREEIKTDEKPGEKENIVEEKSINDKVEDIVEEKPFDKELIETSANSFEKVDEEKTKKEDEAKVKLVEKEKFKTKVEQTAEDEKTNEPEKQEKNPIEDKTIELEKEKQEDAKDSEKIVLKNEFDEDSIKEIVNKQVEELKKKKSDRKSDSKNKKEELPQVTANMSEDDMINTILEQVDKIKQTKQSNSPKDAEVKDDNKRKVESEKIEKKENKKEKVEEKKKTELSNKSEKPLESLDEFIKNKKVKAGEIKEEEGKIAYKTKYSIAKGDKNPKEAITFLSELAEEHRKAYEVQKENSALSEHLKQEKKEINKFPHRFKFKAVHFTHKTLKQTIVSFFDSEKDKNDENLIIDPKESQKKIQSKKKIEANNKPKEEKLIEKVSEKEKVSKTKEPAKKDKAKKETKSEEIKAEKKELSVAEKILLKVAQKKKEKKEKNDPIEKFIKEEPRIDRNKPIAEGDISGNSAEDNGTIVTPTLAQLYFKQKLYNKAIDAYEKLSLKNPEKNSYFAAQIEKIKKIINEQNKD